jgi:hypothetical protein
MLLSFWFGLCESSLLFHFRHFYTLSLVGQLIHSDVVLCFPFASANLQNLQSPLNLPKELRGARQISLIVCLWLFLPSFFFLRRPIPLMNEWGE